MIFVNIFFVLQIRIGIFDKTYVEKKTAQESENVMISLHPPHLAHEAKPNISFILCWCCYKKKTNCEFLC